MQVDHLQRVAARPAGPRTRCRRTAATTRPSIPGIANEFSTAAFRLGHSLLGDDVEFLDNNGLPVADEVPLSQAFFNPPLVDGPTASTPILKYLASDPSSELDTTSRRQRAQLPLRPAGRGRPRPGEPEHPARPRPRPGRLQHHAGRLRPAAGHRASRRSPPNADVQAKLQQLYGSVDNIDAWVGGLAEDHVAAAARARSIRAVLVDQFTRLRDGDRFWYERTFSGPMLQGLERTTLADVIRRNTTLTNLQANVFFFRVSASGTVFADANRDGRRDFNERPLANLRVNLIDLSGEIVGTATTDARGVFRFDISNGLGVGRYTVRVELPNGLTQTTPDSVISITRGDTMVTRNLGVAGAGQFVSGRSAPLASSTTDPLSDLLSAIDLTTVSVPLRRELPRTAPVESWNSVEPGRPCSRECKRNCRSLGSSI